MPFLPVSAISHSQAIRIGNGPGPRIVSALRNSPFDPQSGALIGPFYTNLTDGNSRRDLYHHHAVGAVITMGVPSRTVYTDLFLVSGGAVTAGTGFGLNVAAGIIQSRYSGAQLAFPASVVTPTAPPVAGTRQDYVAVTPAGVVSVIPGPSDATAPTFQVLSVATSGAPTGGSVTLTFTYAGFVFTTAAIAFNATAATVASAILAATGGPNNSSLSALVPSGTLTGSGGPLGTAAVVLTAGGGLEGGLTSFYVANALTGGANPAATVTQTTAAVGAGVPVLGGGFLILAPVAVPSTATSSANYTIGSGLTLTS